MKHFLIILMCIPAMLFAQDGKNYLAGAVPEVDGKVTFTKEFSSLPLTQDQIYDLVLFWANGRFTPSDEHQSNRVLYSNKEKGQIACGGEEFLTFHKKALSVDRATINYRVIFNCAPGKCNVEISGIRYEYNVSYKKDPEKYLAEDWITDKHALHKGKLVRGNGKFRTATIDLADEIFAEIKNLIGNSLVSDATSQSAAVKTTSAATLTPATPVASSASAPTAQTSELQGYKRISPDKIPGNIIKMLTEDWMLITAGNDQEFNMMTAGWGGLGSMFGKPVAFCFIAPTRHTYKLMEKGDTYTLTFYTETYREALNICGSKSGKDTDKVKETGLTPITTPSGSKAFSEAWLVIECKKLISQSITPEAIDNKALKEEWAGKQLHKMFIGEIINVWVK